MKRITWLYVAAGLLIQFVVVPEVVRIVPTLAAADFVTRYIPPRLAPVDWGLGLFLIAVCEGPLLKPKYLSIALNVLLLVCVLFFIGSWNFHPRISPVVSVVAYIELNWLVPLWEAKRIRHTAPTPESPVK
jgi:hypothetical protein